MDALNTLIFVQKMLQTITVAATPDNARRLNAIYNAIENAQAEANEEGDKNGRD